MFDNSGYAPKDLVFGDDGRGRLIDGIKKIAAAVKSTLGPGGNTVLIESPHHTHSITVTKDGVTVAKAVDLFDPVENLAVRMMKEAAERTATSAGDGPQPLYAKVLTPTGFIAMSELKVGDTILDTNGTSQSVLGVFPKGDLEIYELKLADGRVVECSSNHLWTVVNQNNGGKLITATTADLIKDYKKTNKHGHNTFKYYIPVPVIDFKEDVYSKERTIDPLLLGMLLGDGSLSGTGSIELSLGLNKVGLLDRIKTPEGISFNVKLYENKNYYRVKFVGQTEDGKYMKDLLNDLGLLGTKSNNKFIPKSYLYAPLDVRQALFSGLTATDGHINSKGLVEFSTISELLSNDYKQLLLSLGLTYNYCLYTREKDHNSYSNTSIHRIAALVGYKHGYKIIDIRATGKYTPMMCIKVSSDNSLYLTDNMVPTHNTTTSIILTEAMVLEGPRLLVSGVNRTKVLRHLSVMCNEVVRQLTAKARKVTGSMLVDVATISANNDAMLGKVIAGVYKEVGRNGIVTVEKSQTSETYSETTKGLQFTRGYLSNLFVNDQKKDECVLEDVMVLVADTEISSVLQIEAILKPIITEGKKLLIIAPCSTNVVNTLAANVVKGNLKICAVPPPNFGYKQHELMQDIAISVGATYFSEKTGDDLSLINYGDLGHAAKIIVSSDKTIILKSEARVKADAVEERVRQLWMAHAIAKRKVDKDFFLERIASLTGGIGVIYVGGNTDLEQKELYDRVDDAVCAVRSALEEGILPGAGKALYEIDHTWLLDGDESDERTIAWHIINAALEAPIRQILANVGLDFDEVYARYTEPGEDIVPDGYGYNVKTGEFGDLIKMGVVDPLKVTRSALQNAVSVASTILSTNAIITMGRSFEIKQH